MPVQKAARRKKAAQNIQPIAVETIKGPLKIQSGRTAKVTASRTVYRGRLFHVDKERVDEPGCPGASRDIVRHGGSVVILAVDDPRKRNPLLVLERQYRHATGRFLYEIPAGKIEPDERPLAAAKRELAEETGFRARAWRRIIRYYPSPGFLAEWMEVFLAEGLEPGPTDRDPDERLEIMLVPLPELLRLIEAGGIHDGKTLVAALLWARSRSKPSRGGAR